ncbi:MAG: conjugal transfer protein TraF [Gammaproteobacteria bacterium]|nr:conjugal transfer protein TraF [Gammaproteobacteria bacterium]MCF6230752.1 conjugal transfer protein TraF [Gammaproteobacteria bacterium]
MSKRLRMLVAISLVAISGGAYALTPPVIDTEALAMGGAGVSSATDNLGNVNPALVGSASRSDSEFFMTPTLYYTDYKINDFSSRLDSFKNNPSAQSLSSLEDSGAYYSWGAAFGVILHSYMATSTVYLNSYSQSYTKLRLVESDLSLPSGGSGYDSIIETVGISIVEAGVSYTSSTSFRFAGLGDVKWGVTGKMLTGVTHQIEQPVETASVNGFNSEGVTSQGVTFDVGFLKEWGRDWAAGIALKNIYPVSLSLADGGSYRYGPHARVGVTRVGYRHRIAVDVDLLKSKALGIYGSTQMIALGVDYDVGGYLKLRAGVNYDLQGTLSETFSAGVSVNSQYFQITLAFIGHSGALNGLGIQTTIGF